jgi:hypothetical protein
MTRHGGLPLVCFIPVTSIEGRDVNDRTNVAGAQMDIFVASTAAPTPTSTAAPTPTSTAAPTPPAPTLTVATNAPVPTGSPEEGTVGLSSFRKTRLERLRELTS